MESLSSYILSIGGIAIFIVGNMLLSRYIVARNKRRYPTIWGAVAGHALLVIGIATAGLGFYAGLFGPVDLGPVTLNPFTFSPTHPRMRRRALEYTRRNMDISRRAAIRWRGASDKALEYTVKNNGDRMISSIDLRFENEAGATPGILNRKLFGPFNPGKTTRSVVEVPHSVKRFYFDPVSRVDPTHVVGAHF